MTVSLTTLERVKAYLDITSGGADTKIANLIPVESQQAANWTGRNTPYEVFTRKKLNGTGTRTLCLPAYPILSVDELFFGNSPIQASTDGVCAYGYTFDDLAITMVGGVFPYARQFVVCSWKSGWLESESALVPAPVGNAATCALQPLTGGLPAVDVGVSYANGVALAPVAGTPNEGQYAFTTGKYTFSAGDANQSVTMTYGYVPAPMEQAVIEMVGLDLKQRDNLGINSKSLAGETISYGTRGMTDSVKEMLQPYRRMTIG